jgi:hypothetical protein
MNGRSRAVPAVLLALLAASVLMPSALRVTADPAIADAGGGFKNATWDFTTPGEYSAPNVSLALGNASLRKTSEWTNFTNDAAFLAANNGTGTSGVVVNSGVRLAGSAANVISDGTFDQAPGPWSYTNGTTRNVTASRDPTAKAKMGHDTPRTQFDSMDNPLVNWNSIGSGGPLITDWARDTAVVQEGSASLRIGMSFPGGAGYAGAQRILGGADWSAYNRLALWLDRTTATPVEVYLFIRDLSATSDSTPPQTISSNWARYRFDFGALAIDPSAVDIVEIRFTSALATTATVFVDDLVLFNYSAFSEAASVSQPFSKPGTSGGLDSVVVRFNVATTPSINVTSSLKLMIDTTLVWSETPAPTGGNRYVDISAFTGTGYLLNFSLELTRINFGEASMSVWIDNVTLTATDYQSGSFTSVAWSPGSAAIWKTATNLSNTPPATSFVVETRTGNTATPGDATWSPWSQVSGGTIGSPPNLYLQWRLLLNTANGSQTPVVMRLNVSFDRYAPTGTVQTAPFNPSDLIGWRRFYASDARPPGTSVDYNVSVGGAWVPAVDGSDLSSLAANGIVVRANLTTANTSLTPSVAWFMVRYEYLGPLSRIVVSPDNVTLTADDTQVYTATGFDAFGHAVPGLFCAWSAGAGTLTNPSATTVTYEPTIPGAWRITCDAGFVSGSANVNVTVGALANIVVLPDPGLVNVTKSLTFSAAGEDADGNAVALTATTWTTTIGQISSAPAPGLQATLQAPATEGSGTITAREGTATGSATVLVVGDNAPRINVTVPDDSRPEDSPTWPLNLTTNARGQMDPDDTLANLKWTMEGLGGDIVTVYGLGTFNRHTLYVTPVPDAVGTDRVTLCLEDAGGARGCQALNFTLTPVNDPPRWVRAVEPISILVGESYTFDFLTYLEDIDTPAYLLSLVTNDPTHITRRGLNLTFTYGEDAVGAPLFIEVTVNDGEATASTMIVVHVTRNPPPRCTLPPPNVELDEDTTLANALGASLDTFCSDPAGEPLAFSAYNFTNLAVWVNLSGTYWNVDIAGMPNFCGADRITFRATDPSNAYAEVSIRVTVRCVNDAPVLSWTEDVHVRFDTAWRLELGTYVFDVDNALDDLTLSTNDTPRASAERFTVTFLYLWAPAPYPAPVTLTLSDGLATDSQAIVVHVSGNAPPELINPLVSLQMNEDEVLRDAINLAFHFEDLEDRDALTYRITWTNVNATIASGLVTLTPARDWFGQETLVIRATDRGGAFAIATVLVEVLPVNDAPVFFLTIPPQEGPGGRPWILDLRNHVRDVDNDFSDLTFSTDSPNVRAVGYVLLFDFPFADRTLDVRVTADDGNLTNFSEFRVVVQGAGIWGAIYWPWSGFAALALAAIGYIGYMRWGDRRYSLEDLFVVGREGRLIMHTTRRLRADRDEDLLAGMLTAIVMFVRDSFKEENEELKKFEFGERTVAVEGSDHVYGAAIFGGSVPDGVYLSLRHFLADMEDRYAEQLLKWSGDVADLPGLKDMMEYFGRRGRYRIGDCKRFAT